MNPIQIRPVPMTHPRATSSRALGLLTLTAALAGPVAAQTAAADPHPGHGAASAPAPAAADPHAGHSAAAAPAPAAITAPAAPVATPADPHAGHGAAPAAPPTGSNIGQATEAGVQVPKQSDSPSAPMEHGSMQGGSAPSDARDPHAWSGGHRLESGPYKLPDVPRLALADEHTFHSLLFDRLEGTRTRHGEDGAAWEARLRIGRDYNRLVIKSEGEAAHGRVEHARTELLYSRALSAYWDLQAGVRIDAGEGPDRDWLAFGVQGLAPYWFEIDATAYLDNHGRSALRLSAEYEIALTQRLAAQPRIEAELHGKDDLARDIGRGLSNVTAGVRLRYEFTPQFAPYVGVERSGSFGRTADLRRAAGERSYATRWVAGARFWF